MSFTNAGETKSLKDIAVYTKDSEGVWSPVTEDTPMPVDVKNANIVIDPTDINLDMAALEALIGALSNPANGSVNKQLSLLVALIDGGKLKIENDVPAITGFATNANMRIIANTTEYNQSNLSGNVLTIPSSQGIQIKNDGNVDFTVTIGIFTFLIKSGEIRSFEFANAFTSVTFGANAVFRAFGITRSA